MISHCIPEDDLVLYALGEFDGQDRQRVDSHLLTCPECLERVRQYQVVQHDLALFDTMPTPESRDNTLDRPPPARENPSRRHMRHTLWNNLSARRSIIAMVLVLALAIAMVSIDDVAGQFPFARQIGLAPDTVGQNVTDFISPSHELPGISVKESLNAHDTGKALPSDRHVPEELPLGLYLDDS